MFIKSKKINVIKVNEISKLTKQLEKYGINILIETQEFAVDEIVCRGLFKVNRKLADVLNLEYIKIREVKGQGGGGVTTKELIKQNSKLIKKNSDAILGLTKIMTKFIDRQEKFNTKQEKNWEEQREFNAKQDKNWEDQQIFNKAIAVHVNFDPTNS